MDVAGNSQFQTRKPSVPHAPILRSIRAGVGRQNRSNTTNLRIVKGAQTVLGKHRLAYRTRRAVEIMKPNEAMILGTFGVRIDAARHQPQGPRDP